MENDSIEKEILEKLSLIPKPEQWKKIWISFRQRIVVLEKEIKELKIKPFCQRKGCIDCTGIKYQPPTNLKENEDEMVLRN